MDYVPPRLYLHEVNTESPHPSHEWHCLFPREEQPALPSQSLFYVHYSDLICSHSTWGICLGMLTTMLSRFYAVNQPSGVRKIYIPVLPCPSPKLSQHGFNSPLYLSFLPEACG